MLLQSSSSAFEKVSSGRQRSAGLRDTVTIAQADSRMDLRSTSSETSAMDPDESQKMKVVSSAEELRQKTQVDNIVRKSSAGVETGEDVTSRQRPARLAFSVDAIMSKGETSGGGGGHSPPRAVPGTAAPGGPGAAAYRGYSPPAPPSPTSLHVPLSHTTAPTAGHPSDRLRGPRASYCEDREKTLSSSSPPFPESGEEEEEEDGEEAPGRREERLSPISSSGMSPAGGGMMVGGEPPGPPPHPFLAAAAAASELGNPRWPPGLHPFPWLGPSHVASTPSEYLPRRA